MNNKVAIYITSPSDSSTCMDISKIATFTHIISIKVIDQPIEIVRNKWDEYTISNNYSLKKLIKTVIESNKIKYDSITIFDNSCYGPFFNMEPILEKYDNDSANLYFLTDSGERVDTNFVTIKKQFLQSKYYINNNSVTLYLDKDNQLTINGLDDKSMLEKNGLTYSIVFKNNRQINVKKYEKKIIYDLDEYIIKLGYPFVPKKLFGLDPIFLIDKCSENVLRNSLVYLQKQQISIDKIIIDAIHYNKLYNLYHNLGLKYIITSDSNKYSKKIAIVCHVYYLDNLSIVMDQIINLSDNIEVFITTDKNNLELFKKYLDQKPPNIHIIGLENIGRDLESLLIFTKTIYSKFDYICFVHDKKSPHLPNIRERESFSKIILENTIDSQEYIDGIINLFES